MRGDRGRRQPGDPEAAVLPRDRPWSADEIARAIPVVQGRIDEALAALKTLGDEAARRRWLYEHRMAEATLRADGRNAETRKAAAMLFEFEQRDETGRPYTPTRYGFEMDLAANAYKNQQRLLAALDSELRVLQSLMVSARQAP